MTQERRVHTPDADDVDVREVSDEDPDDAIWRIRMPATSTAEARDGVAFDREKVEGFREQIANEKIPVFLDHGRNHHSGSRYSAAGRVGYLSEPELQDRDGVTDLVVDFVLMDPAEMDAEGFARDALALIRDQAEAGLPIASSIGWSDDTGDRDLPGGADLLECSLVGVGSDPRTTTASAEPAAMARAVSAASSDFDVEAFVRELEARAEYDVGDETLDITPPDAMQEAATLALAKDDELDTDCGTGVGSRRARQIAGDDVGPDVVDEVAAYLTSHEEDVTADGTPSEWSDEEWRDCGNLQYAKWGGTGGGTGLDWAQRKANEVAEARGEELPYPERSMTDNTHNLDDPEFDVGDGVMWSSNDTPVHGRVAEIGDEFEPAEGVVITGDEGEAVYLIHELDDSLEPPQYRRKNVAKPESSLDESTMDLPPTEGNFADSENSMSDSDTESEESDDTTREEPDLRAMEEKMDEMREMLDENTRMCEEIHEEMVGGHGDEEDAEESAEPEEENDAPDEEERTVTLDGEDLPVDEARERIASLREEATDVEPDDVEEPETRDVADEDDEDVETVDGEERSGDEDIDWRA